MVTSCVKALLVVWLSESQVPSVYAEFRHSDYRPVHLENSTYYPGVGGPLHGTAPSHLCILSPIFDAFHSRLGSRSSVSLTDWLQYTRRAFPRQPLAYPWAIARCCLFCHSGCLSPCLAAKTACITSSILKVLGAGALASLFLGSSSRGGAPPSRTPCSLQYTS